MITSDLSTKSFLELDFEYNDSGGYFSKRITKSIVPVEINLIVWPPGSKARAHDHGSVYSACIVLPINKTACLKAGFFNCEGGELKLSKSENLDSKSFHQVLPYQIHEIENNSNEWIFTLNLYYPPRD